MGDDVTNDPIVSHVRVAKPPDDVYAFLLNPRNHFTANHKGQTVEQSDGPIHDGSFFVLEFDQLRARVTYEAVSPPERVVVAIALSGRLSWGIRSHRDFLLHVDGDGTDIEVRSRGSGGWISWGPLVRAGERAWVGHLKRKIESA